MVAVVVPWHDEIGLHIILIKEYAAAVEYAGISQCFSAHVIKIVLIEVVVEEYLQLFADLNCLEAAFDCIHIRSHMRSRNL